MILALLAALTLQSPDTDHLDRYLRLLVATELARDGRLAAMPESTFQRVFLGRETPPPLRLKPVYVTRAQSPDPACVLTFNKAADSAAKAHIPSYKARLTAYQKRALARIDSMARILCPDATVPTPEPPDTTTPAPIPPPSGDVQKILAVIGPTRTVADTRLLGNPFAKYDSTFTQYLPTTDLTTCDGNVVLWCSNYYDRGVVHYARYARTGDTTFRSRGHAIVLDYRQKYIEPNNYGASPHWAQVRGLELHYRLTGDTLSRRAVAGIYAHGLNSYSLPLWGDPKIPDLQNPNSAYMENRIQARVLQGALSAYRMGASFDGFPVANWPAKLRTILNQILSVQKADGSFDWIQICHGQLNYMVGMLNDVLIEYFRDFEADARIPVAIEKANEYLWSTQWLATDQAFKYASVFCSPNPFGASVGGPDPAGDLNGLMIASFGWLYQRTGDAKWKTRGDAIMVGLVSARWAQNYTGSKQFNQAFSEAYRYLGWR